MKFPSFAVLVGVAVCCSSGVFSIDCKNKESLLAEQQKCFVRFGIAEALNGMDDVQNVIQKDPSVVCRNLEGYKSAFRCSMAVAYDCMAAVGQSADLLPDVDKLLEGVQYVCDNIEDIDLQCAIESQTTLKHCAVGKAMSVFSENTNMDPTFITCKAFEITVDCIRETMDRCSGETMDIYVRFTQHYLTPPACQTDRVTPAPESGYVFTTMAPMVTAQLVTVVPMLPNVSCYTASGMQAGQLQCFEREGITIRLPHVRLRDGTRAKQSYLDAVMANNNDIYAVCRDLSRYQRAIGCAMDTARRCMPYGYKDYLPSADNVKMMLGELCNNKEDINQQCITSKASDLFDCGFNKGLEKRMTDTKSLLCNAFKWNVECQSEVLPPCGCRTTQLYVRITMEYLNPPACAPIRQALPQCSAHVDEFISTASVSGASATLLVVASLLTACLRL